MNDPEVQSHPRADRPGRELGDTVLFAIMASISVAVVAILYLGLHLSLQFSVLAGLTYLAALSAVFAVSRRSGTIKSLNSEIEDLKSELELMRLGHYQRMSEAAHASPTASRTPAAPHHQAAAGHPPGQGAPAAPPAFTAHTPPPGQGAAPAWAHAGHQTPQATPAAPPAWQSAGTPAQSPGQSHAANPAAMPHGTGQARARPPAQPTQAHTRPSQPPVQPDTAEPWPQRAPAQPDSTLDVGAMQSLIEQLSAKLNQPLTPEEQLQAEARLAAERSAAPPPHPSPATDMPTDSSQPTPPAGPPPTPVRQRSGHTGMPPQPTYDVHRQQAEHRRPPMQGQRPHPMPAHEPPALPAAPYGHLALIAEAVESNRMDVYLDPILGLADRKARHFELSVRLRSESGDELAPEIYGEIAAGTGLLARIDATKLTHAADVVQRLKSRGTRASLFSTLTGESLADENFLGTFADLLASEDDVGTRLVLTFTQADARTFSSMHWQSIAAMSKIGLKFALGEVTDLDMDFAALKRYGFEFIKLDATVFLDGMPVPGGHVPAADICRHLSNEGFGLIVGGILSERELGRILGFGAVLGQGTLFGGARSVEIDRVRKAA